MELNALFIKSIIQCVIVTPKCTLINCNSAKHFLGTAETSETGTQQYEKSCRGEKTDVYRSGGGAMTLLENHFQLYEKL